MIDKIIFLDPLIRTSCFYFEIFEAAGKSRICLSVNGRFTSLFISNWNCEILQESNSTRRDEKIQSELQLGFYLAGSQSLGLQSGQLLFQSCRTKTEHSKAFSKQAKLAERPRNVSTSFLQHR